MKETFGHQLPYPEGNDMADGAAQLEQLAWRMDDLLLAIDAAHQAMNYQRQFVRVSMTGTDTGFAANTDGYVNYDTVDELFVAGGGWDGTYMYTGDQNIPHNGYPSLWLIQAALRIQASGSVTALSWRQLKFDIRHIDPVSGEQVIEMPYVRTRTKASLIDGVTFMYLARLEAPTGIATILRHDNIASSMNVLSGSHMSLTRIGDCD